MLDVLLGIALLALGFLLGRRTRPLPACENEQAQRILQEDHAAFEQLLGYNARRAYGAEGNEHGF